MSTKVRDPKAPPQTLAQALAAGTAWLRGAGLPTPGRDARALLAHAAGLTPDRLTLHLVTALPPEAGARYAAALEARLARQPVAQITGSRLFWGRPFRVTRDVLDPRPETETLVATALAEPAEEVLDLGTGSGCILLSLLADWPGARGLGVDVSPAALAVAQANAETLGLASRARFLESDWAASVEGRFDLIVANPPYISAVEMAELAPEVRAWEPHGALTPGGDGLAAYRAFLPQLAPLLPTGGRVLLEIGPTQADAVQALASRAGLVKLTVHADLDGRPRVVAGRAPLG